MAKISRAFALILMLLPAVLFAQNSTPSQTLFTNVKIFDGKQNKLMEGNVLG